MKFLYFIIIIINTTYSQNYKLTCFGFHTTDIKQIIHEHGEIKYEIQNRGLMDMVWPANNIYSTIYNSKTFSIKSWRKKIQQGTYKSSLKAEVNSNGNLLYDDKQLVELHGPVHTIFTMLAMVQSYSQEQIDTKWIPYEHQGKTGRARFLWSDSLMIWDGKDSILCDHYRMDIDIVDSAYVIKNTKDYFMDNINDISYVKELWVKRGEEKTIIQASAKNNWITLLAQVIP